MLTEARLGKASYVLHSAPSLDLKSSILLARRDLEVLYLEISPVSYLIGSEQKDYLSNIIQS